MNMNLPNWKNEKIRYIEVMDDNCEVNFDNISDNMTKSRIFATNSKV